jgi:hypothetical protein
MPVKHTPNIEEAQRRHREAMAEDQNQAVKQHLSWAEFRVPVESGRLKKSLRQTQEATPDKPVAVAMAGGIEVDGKMVLHAAAVNNGSHHVSPTGKEYSIPPDPFWTESEEVGRDTIKRRAANRRRETRQRGRRGF